MSRQAVLPVPASVEDLEIALGRQRYLDGKVTLPEFETIVGRALAGERPSSDGLASATVGAPMKFDEIAPR